MKQGLVILLLVIFWACNRQTTVEKTESIVIDIIPFEDVTDEQALLVYKECLKVYPKVILKPKEQIPPKAYYKLRNRYRADTILRFLNKKTPDGHVTIALTNKDISHTKGSVTDYGIMGLGLCPGKACVASTFRLSDKKRADQFFKVAIHELGHTQGLPHCDIKWCFMRDAKGKNPTDEETGFCENCKAVLLKKGWKL